MPAAYVICLSMYMQGKGGYRDLRVNACPCKGDLGGNHCMGWSWNQLFQKIEIFLFSFNGSTKYLGLPIISNKRGRGKGTKPVVSASEQWWVTNPTSVFCLEQQELQMFACIITVQSLMRVVCVVVIPQKLYFSFNTLACLGMTDHYLLFKISWKCLAKCSEFCGGRQWIWGLGLRKCCIKKGCCVYSSMLPGINERRGEQHRAGPVCLAYIQLLNSWHRPLQP